MATKLYNGLLFSHTNLTSIRNNLLQLKKELQTAVNDIVDEGIAKQSAVYLDTDIVREFYPLPKSPLQSIIKKVARDTRARIKDNALSPTRDPGFDFHTSIVLIPSNYKILAYVLTDYQPFFKKIMEHTGAAYYGYWNNSDKPDNCTSPDWDTREKDWDTAMPKGVNTFSDAGFIYELVPAGYYQNRGIDSILNRSPSILDRATRVVDEVVYPLHLAEIAPSANESISGFMKADREFRSSDAGAEWRINAIISTIAKISEFYSSTNPDTSS